MEHVQSLARGLAVIRAFDADHPRMTLSELAARTNLTRATARRFLLTLAGLGYVSTDGKLFELTPRVLELGFSYLSGLTLPEIAQPHLEALSRELDESTSALDPEMIAEVLDVMVSLASDGMTMICVTHEMGFARKVADQVVFMDEGKVVEAGEPARLFDAPQSDRLRRFLSEVL